MAVSIGTFGDNALLFLLSLLSHWLDFLKGSAVVVVWGLIEKFSKRQIHVKWYAIFLTVLAFFSCFQAWLDQHTSAEGRLVENAKLRGELEEKRQYPSQAPQVVRAAKESQPELGLMTPSAMLGIIAGMRSAARNASPVTFVVTGPSVSDNQTRLLSQEVTAILAESCESSPNTMGMYSQPGLCSINDLSSLL